MHVNVNQIQRECQLACSIYEFLSSSSVDGKNVLEKVLQNEWMNEWMNEVCLSTEKRRKNQMKTTFLEMFTYPGLEEMKPSLEEMEKKFNQRFQFIDRFDCLKTFYDCLQTSCYALLEMKPNGNNIQGDFEQDSHFPGETKTAAKRGYIDAADVCIEYNCRNLTPGSYLYFKCVKKYRCIVGK